MSQLTVNQQVEKLIDEGEGARRMVLLSVEGGKAERNAFRETLEMLAEDVTYQQGIQNPRDLLSVSGVRNGRSVGSTPTEDKAADGKRTPPAIMPSEIRTQFERSIRSLLKAETIHQYADNPTKGLISEFAAANTVLVELTKDEIVKVVRETEGISAVTPNQFWQLPQVVEPHSLPATVTDNKTSSWGIHAIGALATWGAYRARGKGVKVGVLDSGVTVSHPDLDGKISAWAEFDQNGQRLLNSVPHDSAPNNGHGTHVAGTIVGGNASGQWIGVAPEATVAAGLVLPGGKGSTAQVLAGMEWALMTEKVDVINLSLGAPFFDFEMPGAYTTMLVTCIQRGVPVVVSIGNEGHQVTGSPGNHIGAIAVGATDHRDQVAGFSGGRTIVRANHVFFDDPAKNFRFPLIYRKPDLSAPGVSVVSSIKDHTWAPFNGTSMAAPHATGAIALLLSATTLRANFTGIERFKEIRKYILGSVEDLGEALHDQRFGIGRLDILRAIGFAKQFGL